MAENTNTERDYPLLPGVRNTPTLIQYTARDMRAYVDADRKARAPADSVTAPAGGVVGEAVARLRCGGLWGAELEDWELQENHGICDKLNEHYAKLGKQVHLDLYLAPPAQAADSVLEDAARYRWLRQNATRAGVNIDIGAGVEISETLDAAVDDARAARKQVANHDNA